MLEQWRGSGTVVEEIGPLDDRAALELLSDHIGRERVEAEPSAAAELAKWCAGVPVLLRAVGGYLVLRRRCRLEDAVGLMRDSRERSRVFGRGDAFTVLDVVFAQLPEPAGPAYRALGVVPAAEMSAGAVAVAAGIDSSQARIGLDVLVEANLLEDLGAGRFAVHAMLRAHAEHLVTRAYSEAERTATARRVVEWYLACAQAADRAVAAERIRLPGAVMQASDDVPALRFADDRAALDWLETEHAALLGCLRIAAEHQWDELVWQLCDPLWALNQSHRHPAAWIEALNQGIEAGKRASNHWVGARLRCLLSRCHVELKQYDRAAAALDGALDLARLSGDVMLEASTLEFAGVVERDAGRPGAALELFDAGRQVLAGLEPGPGPQRADLILRYHTGKALTALGRIDEARTVLEAAYPEAQLGDARLAGRVRLALIAALLAGFEPARARDLAASALDEASRRRVPEERINALRILARSCEALGERDSAEGYAAEANTIERALQGWSSVAS
jgi:tetratricopeptide (TPR) repeat protein